MEILFMPVIKGVIDSVNAENCTCNVMIPDQDERIISDLLIVYPGTFEVQDYSIPFIGQLVVCILDSNDDTDGFIMGGTYNKTQKPPIGNPKIRMTKYPDGSTIGYDMENNKLFINLNGDAEISAKKTSIDAANIILNGTVRVNGELIINDKNWLEHQHDAGEATLKTSDGKVVVGHTGDGDVL